MAIIKTDFDLQHNYILFLTFVHLVQIIYIYYHN